MWTDQDKDRFFDAVKDAVMSGASPDQLFEELEHDYYLSLDDLKRSATYAFKRLQASR